MAIKCKGVWSMKFSQYLRDKSMECILFTGTGIAAGMFLLVLSAELPVILMCELPFFFVFFLCLYLDHSRKKEYYESLLQVFEDLDEKRYLSETVERPSFLEGKICHSILRQMEKDMNDQAIRQEMEFSAYKNYIESWVHEVKLPIASSKLLIENHKNEVTLSLEEELDRIDNYVEQVLYYARSENVEEDYHLEWTKLEPVIRQTVKRFARDLISHNVMPSIEVKECTVMTDAKWLSFILGQLIQNAVKYCGPDAKVRFYVRQEKGETFLYVEDNGIGIAARDLPRVFDRGYTGENIRKSSNATGMGLYLCRQLCLKMGLSLAIDSQQGRGTSICIGFPNCGPKET